MEITGLELFIYAALSFIMYVFSGIAGGGAGFITPLMIALGLSPAQAVATGKLTGLGVTGGSLHGLRNVKVSSRRRVWIFMAMALIVGLIAPFFITNLENDIYRVALGMLMLLMIPVLIWKRVGLETARTSRAQKVMGYVLVPIVLMLQAVFSGGAGMLFPVVLMAFIGMSALEANVTKRWVHILMNIVIVLGVIGTGLVVWKIAIVGLIAAITGGAVGSRIAIKKGNAFVMYVMIGLILISSLWLIFG